MTTIHVFFKNKEYTSIVVSEETAETIKSFWISSTNRMWVDNENPDSSIKLVCLDFNAVQQMSFEVNTCLVPS